MCLCAYLVCVPICSTAKNKPKKEKKYEKLDCCIVAVVIYVVILFRTSKHLTKFIEEADGWKVKMGNNQKAAVLGLCLRLTLGNLY